MGEGQGGEEQGTRIKEQEESESEVSLPSELRDHSNDPSPDPLDGIEEEAESESGGVEQSTPEPPEAVVEEAEDGWGKIRDSRNSWISRKSGMPGIS